MKAHRFVALATATLVSGTSLAQLEAAQLAYTVPFSIYGYQTTQLNGSSASGIPVNVPAFDQSLGTLDSLTFSTSLTVSQEVSVQASRSYDITLYGQFTPLLVSYVPVGNVIFGSVTVSPAVRYNWGPIAQPINTSGYHLEGPVSISTPSQTILQDSSLRQNTQLPTGGYAAPFPSGVTVIWVDYRYNQSGESLVTPYNSLGLWYPYLGYTSNQNTPMNGVLSLQYNYSPVPEPTGATAFGLAAAACSIRRRR